MTGTRYAHEVENPLQDIPRIRAIEDPVEQAREIGRVLNELPKWQTELKELRQAAVQKLRARGMSHQEIADELGISRNRAANIAAGLT